MAKLATAATRANMAVGDTLTPIVAAHHPGPNDHGVGNGNHPVYEAHQQGGGQQQPSFEMLSEDPPYVRDVSETEGIAAIALLTQACGHSFSRSNSGSGGAGAAGGVGSAGAVRVDSASWVNLIGSGGEPTCSLPNLEFPVSSNGTRSNSSSSGISGAGSSSGAGAVRSSGALIMGNDPGPMPGHVPFGGDKRNTRQVGPGRPQPPRMRPSRSRTSWERRLFASPLDKSSEGPNDRDGGSGGGGGDGGAGATGPHIYTRVYRGAPHTDISGGFSGRGYHNDAIAPTYRQCSFDPHEDVFDLGLTPPPPHEAPSWRPRPIPAMPPASYMTRARPMMVGSGTHVGSFVESRVVSDGGPGGGIEVAAPTIYPPQSWTVAPARVPAPTRGAEAAPTNRLSGGSAAAPSWEAAVPRAPEGSSNRRKNDEDDGSHGRKPSFDHLKSLIPGLAALSGGGRHGTNNGNDGKPDNHHGHHHRSASSFSELGSTGRPVLAGHLSAPPGGGIVGGGTGGRMESPGSGEDAVGLKRSFSALAGTSGSAVGGTVSGGLPIGGKILTPRQLAIQRYMRKRARRPFVKAAREQDPARTLQNKSRERPRQRGKFVKARPDFLSITSIKPHVDVARGVSGEDPTLLAAANAVVGAAPANSAGTNAAFAGGGSAESGADGLKGKGRALNGAEQSSGDSEEENVSVEEESTESEEAEDYDSKGVSLGVSSRGSLSCRSR